MAFDFSSASGESFGDINDIFFKKGGQSIIPQTSNNNDGMVNLAEIRNNVVEISKNATKKINNGISQTIITINKDVLSVEADVNIVLTELEERRMNSTSIRQKEFIDINNGESIKIIEKTEMYNGVNLFSVQHENGKTITYPRGMFVGSEKKFVPKTFYIREAERALEDTIDKFYEQIYDIINDTSNLFETSDGRFIEIVLETPLDIIGGMQVPDKLQIPVKRMFDMTYKIMILENVICINNKVVGLLFIDIWF